MFKFKNAYIMDYRRGKSNYIQDFVKRYYFHHKDIKHNVWLYACVMYNNIMMANVH